MEFLDHGNNFLNWLRWFSSPYYFSLVFPFPFSRGHLGDSSPPGITRCTGNSIHCIIALYPFQRDTSLAVCSRMRSGTVQNLQRTQPSPQWSPDALPTSKSPTGSIPTVFFLHIYSLIRLLFSDSLLSHYLFLQLWFQHSSSRSLSVHEATAVSHHRIREQHSIPCKNSTSFILFC